MAIDDKAIQRLQLQAEAADRLATDIVIELGQAMRKKKALANDPNVTMVMGFARGFLLGSGKQIPEIPGLEVAEVEEEEEVEERAPLGKRSTKQQQELATTAPAGNA